jgi:putative inorganic carbon (HCO3(-)) transporter
LCGLVQAAVGYVQLNAQTLALATWQDPNINAELKITRIFGTLLPLNPNLLAGFVVPIAGLAMHWAAVSLYTVIDGVSLWCSQYFGASSRTSEHSLTKSQWLQAIVLIAVALTLVWASVATGSRGAYIAIAMMAGVMFLFHGHLIFRRPIWRSVGLKVGWLVLAVGAVAAVAFVLIKSDALRHRVMSIFSMYEDSSIAYRLHVYQAAWHMIQDNWLFGIGPGNKTFQQIYGLYMVPGYNALGAYSVPLEIWLEQGLLGLMCYGSMLMAVLCRCFHALDSQKNGLILNTVIVVFIALVGVWVYGWFDTIWYRPIVQWQCWCLLASFAVLTQSPQLAHSNRSPSEAIS